MLVLPTFLSAQLHPWSPGGALSLNMGRSKNEFAYLYPARLASKFTIEFWTLGSSPVPNRNFFVSVAHPQNDNLFLWGPHAYVLRERLTELPSCAGFHWCHQAITVDTSSCPNYTLELYVNGRPRLTKSGTFVKAVPCTYFEEEVLSIVFGADQDGVLSGWDSDQFFSGHFDDIRLWSIVRSASEIRDSYRLRPDPSTPGLLAYFGFDDPFGSTCFLDQVARTQCMYVVDWMDSSSRVQELKKSPSPAAIAALTLSTAPICSGEGRATVRIQPHGAARIPFESLYCGGNGGVSITTSPFQGGHVLHQSTEEPTESIVYQAASGVLHPDAGFNYTVRDLTTGRERAGFVAVVLDRPPVLGTLMSPVGEEDVELSMWVPVTDFDNDIVHVEIVSHPDEGVATTDSPLHRSLVYRGEANRFGNDIAVVKLRVTDWWGGRSNIMQVIHARPNFGRFGGKGGRYCAELMRDKL